MIFWKGKIILPMFIVTSIFFYGRTQNPDPLSFFPHHLGDYWEYKHYDMSCLPFGYSSSRVTLDSLLPNGNYFVEKGQKYYINTTTYEVFFPSPNETTYVYYKLDAQVGEKWIRGDSSAAGYSYAIVTDIFMTTIFFVNCTVKVIEFWDKGEVDSLWTHTEYLASGFGLVRSDVEGGCPIGDQHITCSIINGILYGTCVLGIDDQVDISVVDGFHLFQNYPNPFNQLTVIRYKLPRTVLVNLSVYDLLGHKVCQLVREVQSAGEYRIEWDGRDNRDSEVSSGIYLIRLNAGAYKNSIKVLLSK